jgi:polar amino acid transport system substrate-binding protein
MRIFLCSLALIVAVTAAACGSSSSSGSSSASNAGSGGGTTASAPHLLVPGQITIGIEPYGPPFQIPPMSHPTGFEISVVEDIVKKLGLKQSDIKWVHVPFDKVVFPGPKQWDMDSDDFTVTPDRAKVVDFSDSYLDTNAGVLVSKTGKGASVKSIADLKKLQLCAQSKTTDLDFIKNTIQPDKAPLEYPSTPLANQAVIAGVCDAELNDLPITEDAVSKSNGKLETVGQIQTGEHLGIVFAKGNPLRDQVNRALAEMRSDGSLQALQQQWFSKELAVPTLQ